MMASTMKSPKTLFATLLAALLVSPCFADRRAQDLVDAFREDDDRTAKVAQDALVALGDDAIKPCQKALNDGNFKVRKRAAEVLGRLGPSARRAAPDLVQLVGDAQYDVQAAAENSLQRMGEDAIPALADALQNSPDGFRKQALSLLSRCGPKAAPIVLRILKKDQSTYMRASAAEALGEIRPAAAETVEALISAFSDLEENVRAAAADALGAIGAPAGVAIGPLITVSHGDKDSLVRKKALDAVARIGPARKESIPGLNAALRDSNPEVRRDVIDSIRISTMTFTESLPLLSSVLKDPDPKVRLMLVQASVVAGGKSAAALPILRIAVNDSAKPVRSAAIEALGQLTEASAEAAAELMHPLGEADPAIRQDAIRALSNLGKAGLVGLIQGLGDNYSPLSDEAAKGILAIGPDAIPSLEALESNTYPVMKKKAQDLLKRLRQPAPKKRRRKTEPS